MPLVRQSWENPLSARPCRSRRQSQTSAHHPRQPILEHGCGGPLRGKSCSPTANAPTSATRPGTAVGSCVHQLERSFGLPFRNVPVAGFGRGGARAQRSARPATAARSLEPQRLFAGCAPARRPQASFLRALDLLLTNKGEGGTQPLVLNDGGLRILPSWLKVR